MTDRLTDVAQQLKGERDTLAIEIDSLKAGLAERQTELSRIDGALKALGEKPNGKKARKPAATKDEVIEAMLSVLDSGNTLAEEELRTQVEQRITEAGKSRMGFSLRFKEALQDSRFVGSTTGYCLAAEEPAHT